MRIAFVTTRYTPLGDPIDGIGRAHRALARAAASDGHEVTVVVPARGGATLEERDGDVRVVRLACPDRVTWRILHRLGLGATAGRLQLAAGVSRALRGTVDIVEAPNWFAFHSLLALRRHRPLVITLLVTPLDTALEVSASARTLDSWLADRLERFAARRSDLCVADSELHLAELRSCGWLPPSARTVVAPLPVDLNPPVRVTQPPRKKQIQILQVGTIGLRKRQDITVRAAAELRARGSDVEVVLVGAPADHHGTQLLEELKAIAAAARFGLVVHQGIDDEFLVGLYLGADVLVQPSAYESFGLPVAEAITLGLPVIVHHRVGAAELVRPGEGIVLRHTTPESVGNAIRSLVPDQRPTVRQFTTRLSPERSWAERSALIAEAQSRRSQIDAPNHIHTQAQAPGAPGKGLPAEPAATVRADAGAQIRTTPDALQIRLADKAAVAVEHARLLRDRLRRARLHRRAITFGEIGQPVPDDVVYGPKKVGGASRPVVLAIITHVSSVHPTAEQAEHSVRRLSATLNGLARSFGHHRLSVRVHTIPGRNVLHLLPEWMQDLVDVTLFSPVDPMMLEFEAVHSLLGAADEIDWGIFLEDDIVVHDPHQLEILSSVNTQLADDRIVLLPHRYEMRQGVKHYFDHAPRNDYRPRHWLPYTTRKAGGIELAEWENPHAGYFCLSGAQLRRWRSMENRWIDDVCWTGPLESAATGVLMEHFVIVKPVPGGMHTFEVEHFGTKYSDQIVGP